MGYKSYRLNKDRINNLYNDLDKRYKHDEIRKKYYLQQYFVGLLDGDGIISVIQTRDKPRITLSIALNNIEENIKMLNLIVKYVGGRIKIERNNRYITWYATSRSDIIKIFAILLKYPLLTTKKKCQLEFAIDIWNNYEKINDKEFKLLRERKYDKQNSLIEWYNLYFNIPIYFPAWLSGFIEAEGHFKLVNYINTNTIKTSQLIIGLNHDVFLLNSIANYFKCYNNKISCILAKSKINYYKIHLSNHHFRSLLSQHFDKYPLLGYKYCQYKLWNINHPINYNNYNYNYNNN